jgi:hypothetical protein
MKEVLERFDKLLKPIFPENAEQRIVENRIVVNWHLNNVPERPNKRSKLIRVTFTHEFLEDYSELSLLQKDKTDAKIKSDIERNFSNFDPDHDKSIHSTPPFVEWRIETSDLVY